MARIGGLSMIILRDDDLIGTLQKHPAIFMSNEFFLTPCTNSPRTLPSDGDPLPTFRYRIGLD